LVEVLKTVNDNIRNLSSLDAMMGTTCTILYCSNNEYTVYHIGDSRCYHISNGYYNQVTKDHSVVKEYNISKQDNPDLYNKYKSKLTRCIGVKKDAFIDTYKGTYNNGDFFLLSSDGFWHQFEESGYQLNLSNLREAVNTCISRGESDNITVSILSV